MSDSDEFTESSQDESTLGKGRLSSGLGSRLAIQEMISPPKHVQALKSMAASAKVFELSPSMKAALAGIQSLEQDSSMKAALAGIKPFELGPSMKAALAGIKPFELGPSMKAALSGIQSLERGPSMKGALAGIKPFELSPLVKAALDGVQSFEQSPSMKGALAGIKPFELSPSMKAALAGIQSLEQGPSMKGALAGIKPFELSPSMKAALAGIQSFESNPSMRSLIAGVKSFRPAIKTLTATNPSLLALDKWGLSSTITLDEVFHEFVARTAEPAEIAPISPVQFQPEREVKSSLGVGDSYHAIVVSPAAPGQPLKAVPTWVLLMWLWLVVPSLILLANWESARAGLVDLNTRLPQTELFADVRKFIRTEMAGKPGDFRLVTGAGVRLRAGPGMKSEVILHLPKDSVVVVLGKEDRTWRFVSYEHMGYVIDGYVSTKFLKKVRR